MYNDNVNNLSDYLRLYGGGFYLGKFSMATVSLCSMILFILTGCIDATSALANFGNANGIMLMSMFVVAAGFRRTQFIHMVSVSVNKLAEGSLTKIMAAYVIITIILSQFIQSPVVVIGIMAPMLAATCAEINVSPSKVMYPLGIAAIATCSALPLDRYISPAAKEETSYAYTRRTDPAESRSRQSNEAIWRCFTGRHGAVPGICKGNFRSHFSG